MPVSTISRFPFWLDECGRAAKDFPRHGLSLEAPNSTYLKSGSLLAEVCCQRNGHLRSRSLSDGATRTGVCMRHHTERRITTDFLERRDSD
jgi:hypothetical protein